MAFDMVLPRVTAVSRFAAVLVLVAACAHRPATEGAEPPTSTPIHHLVVVFEENVSFDHYFGTYPMPPTPTASRSTPGPTLPRSTASPQIC